MAKIPYKYITLASMLLFALSMTLENVELNGSFRHGYAETWGLLLIGWLGVLVGGISWLANPLIIAAWIANTYRRPKLALNCALLAAGLSSYFLTVDRLITDEGGGYSTVTGYGRGFWLWLASCWVFTILQGLSLFLGQEARADD